MSATLRQPLPADAAATPAKVVSLSHVNKTFKLPHESYHTLKQRVLHGFRAPGYDVLKAVNDVSVEVEAGEFFGVVGRNGSGKSTLLKCLAGIYDIDSGMIDIRGRLSPFIELGVGFNPELTARDNVIINAIMLGLSRKQAYERFDAIVEFAELEEFMDLKLKNYSSGMQIRLAFSVAIQVDAEIVLIDEVLAVGDASFQQKCYEEFIRMKKSGRTIMFVTHDMGAVERFCDRAMLMEQGRVLDVGVPAEIARQYSQQNFQRVREEARRTGTGSETLHAAPVAEVSSAVFESEDGEPLVTADQGRRARVRMEVRFHADVVDPIFAITLRDERDQNVFSTSTQLRKLDTGSWRAGDVATVRLSFDNRFGSGRYQLIATVARGGSGLAVLDMNTDTSLIVIAPLGGGGIVDVVHDFVVERS